MTQPDRQLLLDTVTCNAREPVVGAVAVGTLGRAQSLAIGARLSSRILSNSSVHDTAVVEQAIEARMAAESHVHWLLDDVAAITDALAGAGIRSIVLKGGALCTAWLTAPADRHLDDIDLLVHPDDVARAEFICDAIGWSWSDVARRLGVDGRPLGEHGRTTHHALAPRTSPNGTSLDLHRHLPGRPHTGRADFERWWRRRHEVSLRGSSVATPHPDDLLWHLCDHVIRHHLAQPRFILRHLADLTDLGARGPRRAAMERLAATPAGWLSVGASLYLWDIAAGRGTPTDRRVASLLIAPPEGAERTIDIGLYLSRMAGRVVWDACHRPRLLARKLVPTDAWMQQEYGVEGGRAAIWSARIRRLLVAPVEPFLGGGDR